jgi:hypothetical protein
VQGSEDRQFLDRPLDGVDYQCRLLKAAPAVDHAVADGVSADEAVDCLRVVAAHEVELQTGGTCIYDQDVHAKGFS